MTVPPDQSDHPAPVRPDERERASPTFIACGARSGSTLLRWLVDTHPDIACPAETDVAMLLHSYVQTASALGSAAGGAAPLERARAVADELMGDYVATAGKSSWCDKSLSNVLHLELLGTAWPDARFLLLHRHCMDLVMSALEAQPWGLSEYGFASFASSSPTDSVLALVAYWIDRTTRMLEFERAHPERCLRVTYEDLVRAPDAVVASIWRFLDVAPLAEPARAAFDTDHVAVGPADYKVWYTTEVRGDSVGRGARIPPDRVAGIARERVNALLAELDYPLVDDSWGSGTGVTRPPPTPADRVVAPARPRTLVELRVVAAADTLWAADVDLVGHRVVEVSPEALPVVAVERDTFEDLRDGRVNVGEAQRARTVRYYGPPLHSFREEREIFGRLASFAASDLAREAVPTTRS